MKPREAETMQNEIYRRMSLQKKLDIASQLILLGRKLKKAKEVKRSKSK